MTDYIFTSTDETEKNSDWALRADSQINYFRGCVRVSIKQMLESGVTKKEIYKQFEKAFETAQNELSSGELTSDEQKLLRTVRDAAESLLDSEKDSLTGIGNQILACLSDRPSEGGNDV